MNAKRSIRNVPPKKNRLSHGLIVSLAANVSLAVSCGMLLFASGSRHTTAWSQPVPDKSAAVTAKPVPEPSGNKAPSSQSQAQAFSWNQLQTPDFSTYISRLRGINCPEPTIHDIVKGELDSIYAERRGQLLIARGEDQRRTLSKSTQNEITKLQQQEDTVLAQLLGLPSPNSSPADPQPAVSAAQNDLPTPSARMTVVENEQDAKPLAQPLVFQEVDPAVLQLEPAQQEIMDQMRAAFLSKIGGSGQNPDDPDYLTRWKQAQFEADTQLRTLMGDDFVARYRANAKNSDDQ